jgi:hypothetical protein
MATALIARLAALLVIAALFIGSGRAETSPVERSFHADKPAVE